MAERVKRNGEDVGLGFGTDLLVTLKFDDAGNWKIVKTHSDVGERSRKERERTMRPFLDTNVKLARFLARSSLPTAALPLCR